jgi:hypothetical protein
MTLQYQPTYTPPLSSHSRTHLTCVIPLISTFKSLARESTSQFSSLTDRSISACSAIICIMYSVDFPVLNNLPKVVY